MHWNLPPKIALNMAVFNPSGSLYSLAVIFLFATLAPNPKCGVAIPKKERIQVSVVIYTKPGCPYCAKAREYYTEKGIPFEDRNAQDNLKYRKEMFDYTGGDPTVPTIVENGKLKQIGWEGRG